MAGLFGRLTRGATRASAGTPSYGLIPPLGSVQSASGLLISQATAMTVGAVYACVTILAQDIARCSPTLYAVGDKGVRTAVTDHPIAKLLVRPNRIQTWFEFMRDLWIAILLRGNGYAAILRDYRGQVSELILINPDAVMVLEAANGDIFYNVNRIGLFQTAVLQQFPVAIPAEDVFHIRGPSFNMLLGVSTIGLARDAIGLAIGQSQQQSRWIGQGAHPAGYLKSPRPLKEDTAKRLKTNWEAFQSGVINTGRTAVLEDGIEFAPLKLTAADVDFINAAQMGVQDVCRFFGVPPRKVGQPDVTRGRTILQEDQAYVNTSVAPRLTLFEQRVLLDFNLESQGLVLDLNEDDLLRADPMTRYNLGRTGKLSGLITTNEWRASERLPPKPGGDELMQPLNMAPLGSDMSGHAADGAGRPAEGEGMSETGNAQDPAPKSS